MLENKQKFSLLSLGSHPTWGQVKVAVEERIFDNPQNNPLDQIVEETRSYLVTFDGGSQREQKRHHERLNRAVLGFAEERKQLLAMIQDFLLKRRVAVDQSPDGRYATMTEAVFAEIIGLNVLELMMRDNSGLEEIQVVGTRIYEVRGGISKPSPYTFRSVLEVERIQQNLVLFNQDTLHIRKRWAEVRLSDGARVTMTGFGFTAEPTLTIRFYSSDIRNLASLCEARHASIDNRTMLMLRGLVRSYINLVIIGSTNSGKTQLLKALVAEMPDHERLVTMESRLELMLQRDFPNKNIVQYEISEDDSLHDGRQAFKLALRQSPKRICHAEIRDEDANLYVRACTRGHAGSMTTLHASQLEDVPDTIAEMCMLDGRAVNSDRLVKRIAEYVTQVGIEIAIVGGQRKVIRIGEYSYDSDRRIVLVRTLISFDDRSGNWIYPMPASRALSSRMKRCDPQSFDQLAEWGLLERC